MIVKETLSSHLYLCRLLFQFARKIIFLKLASVVDVPDPSLTEHFFFFFSPV